jgi:hypothetical protein
LAGLGTIHFDDYVTPKVSYALVVGGIRATEKDLVGGGIPVGFFLNCDAGKTVSELDVPSRNGQVLHVQNRTGPARTRAPGGLSVGLFLRPWGRND